MVHEDEIMTPFALLLSIIDTFAGEFGRQGTPIALIILAFPVSVFGFVRGCQILVRIYDLLVHKREIPPSIIVAAATLFLVLELSLGGLVITGTIAPDSYFVLIAAFALAALPKGPKTAKEMD